MQIFPMQEHHIDDLARLEQMCFSQPWSRTALLEEIKNPSAVFRVAEEDGCTLGYAGMHVVCGEGYIDNIAVFPEARRKGVARQLINSLIEWLREQEGAFLTLEVRPSNAAAVSLYRSLGFQEVGRRPHFYTGPTEDALLMTFTLGNQ